MVNVSIPDAASSMPIGTSSLGPNRGMSRFDWICAVMMIDTTIGRNPTPVCIGDDHVQCFDDDPCTRDTCRSFACENTAPVSLPTASCRVGRFQDENVCDDPLVAAAERLLAKRSEAALRLIESITGAMKAKKVVKVLTKAQKQLTRIERRISRGKLASQVDEACRTRLLALVAAGRAALEDLASLYRS